MILCYFLKLLSECALYFAAANCLIAIAMVEIDSFVPAILCAAVGALAYWMEEKYSKYRYLVLPLLVGVFLFAKGIGTAMVLFLPVLYVVLSVKDKRYFVDAEKQANLFRFGLAGAFVLYFMFALVIGVRWVVPFILLFLFVNMFLMRLLRQNPAYLNDKRFLLTNAAHLGIALAVTALLTTDTVVQFIKNILTQLYHSLFAPLLEGLTTVLFLAGRLLYVFFFEILQPEIQHKKHRSPNLTQDNWLNEEIIAPLEEQLGMDSLVVTVVQVLLLLIGIVLVVLYVKKLRRGKNSSEIGTIQEKRRAVTERRPEEEKFQLDLVAPKDPRAAVRYYYRKFLQLCRKLEYQFPLSFTSEQIQNSVSKELGAESAKKIRETYIRARYSNEKIEAEEVSAMKEEVNKLREEFAPTKTEK